jgi:glutamine amidotransferase
MKVAIINYGAGNIRSLTYALERLGVQPLLTADAEEIRTADRVFFPGVGAAGYAMTQLRASGLADLVPALQQPVMGICLGMQLMCAHSEENDTPALGIFPLAVRKFPEGQGQKVPQMGWNQTHRTDNNTSDWLYFVHSYYAELGDATLATCEYILPFSAALRSDNFLGVQFHPEKSGSVGANWLQSFLLQG